MKNSWIQGSLHKKNRSWIQWAYIRGHSPFKFKRSNCTDEYSKSKRLFNQCDDKSDFWRNWRNFNVWLWRDFERNSRNQKNPDKIDEILEQFRKTLKTKHNVSKEHRDFILMKEIYHCTPSELEKQDEHVLSMHYAMIMIEREEEFIEMKRKEQKAKVSNSKK